MVHMKGRNFNFYLFSVIMLMLMLPIISIVLEILLTKSNQGIMSLIGKWFVFWVGIRLFTAGLRQSISPSFTAINIFNMKTTESYVIIKELGFANITMGLAGIISIFVPSWRIVGAFLGGLFLGVAGIQHIINKPKEFNEKIALVSDIFIFILMSIYFISSI